MYIKLIYLRCHENIRNEIRECILRINNRNRCAESKIDESFLKIIIENTEIFYENWIGPKMILITNNFFNTFKKQIVDFIIQPIKNV